MFAIRLARLVKPTKRFYSTTPGLPFKIDATKANELLKNKRGAMESKTSDDKLITCFVPFYSADIRSLSSTYTAKYGVERTEYHTTLQYNAALKIPMPTVQSKTIIDWHTITDNMMAIDYPLGKKFLQTYAGFIYPRELIEKVLPTKNLVSLQNLTSDMVKDKIIYPHEMKYDYAVEKIINRIVEAEKSRIKYYIKIKYDTDNVVVESVNVHFNKAGVKMYQYYIPAYISETNINETYKYKIMNAYTGDSYSNNVYSVYKTSMLGAGLTGLSMVGIGLFMPHLLPIKIAMASGAGGVLTGTFAKASNVWKSNGYTMQMESEAKTNMNYKADYNDEARRRFAKQCNDQFDYVRVANLRLPIDKLKILQLDAGSEINLTTLKVAYLKQIRQWHPDTHTNKDLAESMTKRINEANAEIRRILNKN